MISDSIFYDEFFAQIEPLLKEAGYATNRINCQMMSVKKGRRAIDIMSYYEEGMDGIFVCFRYIIRGKFLKQLSVSGRMVLSNALSAINPAFNIAYHQKGCCISVRYNCNVHDAKAIISHLNNANECYSDLLKDLHKRFPEMLNAFPCPDTIDKQLEKTIVHLHRWHIE